MPRERRHGAAVRVQAPAADHGRPQGLRVRVRHPTAAAAAHLPGARLGHQGPGPGQLRGLLRHRLRRGQHEGEWRPLKNPFNVFQGFLFFLGLGIAFLSATVMTRFEFNLISFHFIEKSLMSPRGDLVYNM